MTKRMVFRLNQVPEDEADDVRALLDAHGIEFFETTAGLLGLWTAGIWLRDPADYDRARALIDDYEHARAIRLRAEWRAQRRAGDRVTLLARLRAQPVTALVYAVAILAVLYLSIVPFFQFR